MCNIRKSNFCKFVSTNYVSLIIKFIVLLFVNFVLLGSIISGLGLTLYSMVDFIFMILKSTVFVFLLLELVIYLIGKLSFIRDDLVKKIVILYTLSISLYLVILRYAIDKNISSLKSLFIFITVSFVISMALGFYINVYKVGK